MGTPANQVKFHFNDLGMVKKDYQAHAGPVDADNNGSDDAPFVEYVFDETSSGTPAVYTYAMRPKYVVYPNGRKVWTTYGSSGSIADKLSRPAAINDDSSGSPGAALAEYGFNGAGRLAVEDFPAPDVKLDYYQGTSGTYAGLDRFGRVKTQLWRYYGGTPADRDKYTYGHDANSNRVYKKNEVSGDKDELYGYDGLNRLVKSERGTVTVSGTPPTPSVDQVKREEDWTLSAMGNWKTYLAKAWNGSTLAAEADHDRTHNAVNEITGYSAQRTSPTWASPGYDARGNMVAGPKGDAPGTRLFFEYDAWDRQVAAWEDTDADGQFEPGTADKKIAEYQYDGRNYRIAKLLADPPAISPNNWDRTDVYYNSGWQVVEEDQARDVSTANKGNVATYAYCQYAWGLRYIDAAVCRWRDSDWDENHTLDEMLYYCNDANMNVTALVDTSGAVVERYLYDPYGRVTFLDANFSPRTNNRSDYDNEILYCGYRFDPERNAYIVRHRPYEPHVSWPTRDPIGYVHRYNLLQYGASAPTAVVDPFGLFAGSVPSYDVKKTVTAQGPDAAQLLDNIERQITTEILVDRKGKPLSTLIDVMGVKLVRKQIGSRLYGGTSGWYFGFTIVPKIIKDSGGKCYCDFSETEFVFVSYWMALPARPGTVPSAYQWNDSTTTADTPETFDEATTNVPAHEGYHTDGFGGDTPTGGASGQTLKDKYPKWDIPRTLGFSGYAGQAWAKALGMPPDGPLYQLVGAIGDANTPKGEKDTGLCMTRLREIMIGAGVPMVNDLGDVNVLKVIDAGSYHKAGNDVEAKWRTPKQE